MCRFDVACMSEFLVCTNCGLVYSTNDHPSCSHCHFTIKCVSLVKELHRGY